MMKYILCILLIIPFLSCTDLEVEPVGSFYKVQGELAQSEGWNLKPWDNNTYILLGSETIVEKRVKQLQTGTEIVEYFRQVVPSLSIIDQYGNMVEGSKGIYPMTEFAVEFGNLTINDAGKFTDIVKTDEGYILVGQWSLVESDFWTQERYDSPFIVAMDENFKITNIQSFNGLAERNYRNGDPADPVYNFGIGLLETGGKIFVGTSSFGEVPGTALNAVFMEVTPQGNILNPTWLTALNDQGEEYIQNLLRYGVLDDNGNAVLFHKRGNTYSERPLAFGVTIVDPISLAYETTNVRFASSLEFYNFRYVEHVLNIEEGYMIFYHDSGDAAMSLCSDSFIEKGYLPIEENVIRVSSAVQTADGGYAILLELDDKITGIAKTRLVKYSAEYERVWSKDFDGYPHQILETADQGLMFIINTPFNNLEKKVNIIKLDKNGNL